MTNLVGQDIGRYHIIEQLGQGGMATVYRAYDTRLEREVALKFIRREEIGPAYLEQLFKRFEREAKSLAQLSHPNVVKVYDYGEFEGVPYLVMEYLPGGTLKQRMGRTMPAAEAARLLLPVARALAYAHHENIIHRDVKPANILITRSGEPMLTDFGIAKILSGDGGATALTGTGVGLGTPDYMAPEQWTNEVVPQTDVYALGIVFYEMVTGRRPFTADTPAAVLLKQMQDTLPRPQSFAPDLPDQAEQLLYKALAKDPQERFATMDLMAAALENLIREPEAQAETRLASKDTQQTVEAKPAPRVPAASTATVVMPPSAKTEPEATIVSSAAPKALAPRPAKMSAWVWAAAGLAVLAVIVVIGVGAVVLANVGKAQPPAVSTSAPTQPATAAKAASPEPAASVPAGKPGLGSTRVADKDSMPQVYVPGSPFLMGTDDATAPAEEKPRHIVNLDAYWMDQTDVTNAMFIKFTSITGYETDAQKDGVGFVYAQGQWASVPGADWLHPQGPSSNIRTLGNHPVVQVTYNDARAYCRWAGRHLPTEAQWEKAARGRDGRLYPWGDGRPDQSLLNFGQQVHGTSQVGVYTTGASPYGALDMAGNVWQWVVDWYDETYYTGSPASNPVGPISGQARLARGGSWFDAADRVRTTARFKLDAGSRGANIGFRCASAP
jgi:eukaryotic-like serine/threonine-protein kinase